MSETVDEGEGNGEGCAEGGGVKGDGASVHADYLAREAQSDAGSAALCGEEGEEDAVGSIRTYAATIIRY